MKHSLKAPVAPIGTQTEPNTGSSAAFARSIKTAVASIAPQSVSQGSIAPPSGAYQRASAS